MGRVYGRPRLQLGQEVASRITTDVRGRHIGGAQSPGALSQALLQTVARSSTFRATAGIRGGSAFSQAIVFSNQGPSQFSALLNFTSNNNVSYAFDFPTAAFRTPGTYTNSPSSNTGTLTVTLVPEPFTGLLLFAGISFGVLLCGNHFRARIKFGATKLDAKARGV